MTDLDKDSTPKILEKALQTASGQRNDDYGKASDNQARIAALWSVVLGKTITVEQVIQCMILVKLSRLVKTPNHADSWLDIAGYVDVYDKVQRGE